MAQLRTRSAKASAHRWQPPNKHDRPLEPNHGFDVVGDAERHMPKKDLREIRESVRRPSPDDGAVVHGVLTRLAADIASRGEQIVSAMQRIDRNNDGA